MIQLKIYNDSNDGSETVNEWTVDPLFDRPEPIIHRSEGDAASATTHGRTHWAKEVRAITFGADLTLYEEDKIGFIRLLLNKRIELKRKRAGVWAWIPFTLVIDREIQFNYLDDIDELKMRDIKLVETNARWYDQFQDIIAECYTDYSILD